MPHSVASIVVLLACSSGVCSGGGVASGQALATAPAPQVAWTTAGAGAPIRLVAERTPVDEILDLIGQRTGTRFHRGTLSREPVTIACEEDDFRQLLSCVLGPDADLVIRTAVNARPGVSSWPDEVWVVSHSAQSVGSASRHPAVASALSSGEKRQSASAMRAVPARETARWMALANSAEPEARAQGLQQLAGSGDVAARQVLQDAFVDGDAEARAQAVFGLGRNGGDEAIATLERALQDQDASVRLMAVDTIDGAGESSALLRAALNDSDDTVRQLAALKLERIAGDAPAEAARR